MVSCVQEINTVNYFVTIVVNHNIDLQHVMAIITVSVLTYVTTLVKRIIIDATVLIVKHAELILIVAVQNLDSIVINSKLSKQIIVNDEHVKHVINEQHNYVRKREPNLVSVRISVNNEDKSVQHSKQLVDFVERS